MAETTFSYSQVESPAEGATLPTGHHVLRGWIWPKPGGHFVDVRARIGFQLFPGVHGLPRPDLSAHFQDERSIALAEFYVAVTLPPGPATICFEALEIEGRWRAFQQVTVTVTPTAASSESKPIKPPLRWIDHGHAFRLLLRELASSSPLSVQDLATKLAGEIPQARILRDAPAPFIGFIDEPASSCCSRFGRIPAFGHLFHPTQRITRMLATVDLQAWQPLQIGRPSPGPASFYPQHLNAHACGFVGLVDVPAQLPNPVSLRLYAELEDGTIHLGHVVHTRVHPNDVEKFPLRSRSGLTFDAALEAWNTALELKGFTISHDEESKHFLHELRQEYDSTPLPIPAPTSPNAIKHAPRKAFPRRIILATHGLSLQGAPRFLLELAQACAEAGSQIVLITAEDGPLRKDFEAIRADIHVVDCNAIHQAPDSTSAHHAISNLLTQANWSEADLVVANSFTTFWAVHAAQAAGIPSLFYVHESTTPRLFYDRRITPAALNLVESAFSTADCISFTTAATRDVHLSYGRPERYVVTPGWAQLARIDRWLTQQDRTALRLDLGVNPDELLVCNIGTVSDRKGQHTFARAVDLLSRRHPAIAARTKFILLGGRDTPFDAMLNDSLAELRCTRISVHPETTDYLRYYLAADLFACSSYEESSPRVIFEAMACRVPIIASAVHGIPELVRHDLEATLVPPGDTSAWADAMPHMLVSRETAVTMAKRARARVENTFSDRALLPQHLELIRTVANSAI